METQPLLLVEADLEKEVSFKMSRSTGNGGQNVNKLSTKASLFFDLSNSKLFSEEMKVYLLNKLVSRLTNEGILIISCQESRSAFKNKKEAVTKLYAVLQQAAQQPKERQVFPTPAKVHSKRLDYKKRQGFKKSMRRKVNGNAVDLFFY